jgi:hypothetical protein
MESLPKIKTVLEVSFFSLLSLVLYLLMILILPFFRESHGLLIETELADISRNSFIKILMFGSAAVCALLGAFMLAWIPSLTAGLMANLWSVTYFFIWVDGVFALSLENQSIRYICSLALGVIFIYFFFFILHYLQGDEAKEGVPEPWKSKLVSHWIWGWMGFYFGLSGLMIYDSVEWSSSRLALAFGAMVLSFLNYLLCLFLKKAEGQEIIEFSRMGRWVFTVWFFGLALLWLIFRWTF